MTPISQLLVLPFSRCFQLLSPCAAQRWRTAATAGPRCSAAVCCSKGTKLHRISALYIHPTSVIRETYPHRPQRAGFARTLHQIGHLNSLSLSLFLSLSLSLPTGESASHLRAKLMRIFAVLLGASRQQQLAHFVALCTFFRYLVVSCGPALRFLYFSFILSIILAPLYFVVSLQLQFRISLTRFSTIILNRSFRLRRFDGVSEMAMPTQTLSHTL